METLSIGGREFVKARKIARELGYTSDYVGQLCRSGKVDAQLVGRTWYVDKDSLLDHKENRYKRKLTGTDTKQESIGEARKLVPNFYDRLSTGEDINYSTDQTDLIPTPQRGKTTGESFKLPIKLADAHSVAVKSKTDSYDFDTPERTRTVFKGDLVVSEIPDIQFAEPDSDEIETVSEAQVEKTSKRNEEQVQKVVKPKANKVHKGKENGSKVKIRLAPRKPKIKKRGELKQKVKPSRTEVTIKSEDQVEPATINISYILTSAIVASFVAAIIMSLESVVYITDQMVLAEYNFDAMDLIAAVYGSK